MTKTFKDHFSTKSTHYALYRPSYPKELAAYLAHLAPDHKLALDCGCGSGQLSLLLAEMFDCVIATDASAEQIAKAKPHPKVQYYIQPAENSALSDKSVDLVTVAQAAHWFDLEKFYKEVKRVLRPRGVVAIMSYNFLEVDEDIKQLLGRFYHQTLDQYWPPERKLVENGYKDILFPFQEITAETFEMAVDWPCEGLIGYVDTWSAVRHLEAKEGREPFTKFADQLRAAWGNPSLQRHITWPLTLRIGYV